MSVDTSVKLGWFVVINEDDDIMENQDILSTKYGKKEWGHFFTGTDPMCGTNDHYCVAESHKFSRSIDLYDHTVVSFFTDFEFPTKIPDEIKEFIDAYKKEFGEDSIALDFGLIAYAH